MSASGRTPYAGLLVAYLAFTVDEARKTLAVVLVFVLLRKHPMRGTTAGAVKG